MDLRNAAPIAQDASIAAHAALATSTAAPAAALAVTTSSAYMAAHPTAAVTPTPLTATTIAASPSWVHGQRVAQLPLVCRGR